MIDLMPTWEVMRDIAIEKLAVAELSNSSCYFTVGYEEAFFSIEIMIKAYILKKNRELDEVRSIKEAKKLCLNDAVVTAYFSHNIEDILGGCTDLEDRFRTDDEEAYNLLMTLCTDARRWEPWKRYQYRADAETAFEYVNQAKGFHKWISPHLKKD